MVSYTLEGGKFPCLAHVEKPTRYPCSVYRYSFTVARSQGCDTPVSIVIYAAELAKISRNSMNDPSIRCLDTRKRTSTLLSRSGDIAGHRRRTAF